MVTVRVFYKSTDKAAKGVGVIILLYDVMFLAIPGETFTDSNGDANINSDLGRGSVYVNGKEVFTGQIESISRPVEGLGSRMQHMSSLKYLTLYPVCATLLPQGGIKSWLKQRLK